MGTATPSLRRRLTVGIASTVLLMLVVSISGLWFYSNLQHQAYRRLQNATQALVAGQHLNFILQDTHRFEDALIDAVRYHEVFDPLTVVGFTEAIQNARYEQSRLNSLQAEMPALAPLVQRLSHLLNQYQSSYYQVAALLEQRLANQSERQLQATRSLLANILSQRHPNSSELIWQLAQAEFMYFHVRHSEGRNQILSLLAQLETVANGVTDAERQTSLHGISMYRDTFLHLVALDQDLSRATTNLQQQVDDLLHTIQEVTEAVTDEQVQAATLLDQANLGALGLIGWMIFTSGSMFGVQWWITNRYVTRPLMKLTAAARQVAAGWRATPIPIAGTDEIGDLARALAQLTADLNDTIATLEERVAQRTAQLEQALTENEALLTRERRRRHSEQVLINLSLALINLCNEEIIYRHLVEILASGNESDNWIGVYTRDTNGFWNLRATGGYQYSHLLQLTAPLALLTRPTNLFYIADLSQQQIDQLPNVQGSVIVATIYLHDQPHALLVIYRPQANAFTEDEIANVNIATRLVSQAITRGQLMVSLQQAKEHAEAVNRARMTFLARLDQAVRQRLNTIVAISETLREVLTDRPVAAEDTDKIARAGRQLLIQLNTLLDNAKIEAGMLTLRPEPFALDTLLDSVLQDIKPLISQNYNQLEIDRPPNLGLIIADMNRLRQVLLYPLRFAASTTRRGVVTVVVRRIPATDQQTFLELIISDTGPTLSNAQVQALLTPFALPPTEPRVADEGSGLALSRQLCELMGGTLTAHSGQFIGLTFTIRLPITFSTEQRAITEPSATLPHPDLVLITATEPHALRSALEQEGWYVHQAATLQEAITALRQPPAAILIDLPSDRAPIEALLRASNWQRTSIVWLVPPDTDQEEPGLMRAVWPGDTKTLIEKLHTVIVHTQPSSKPILVIEDEAPTRLIIRRFLEHEGWNVIEASNVAVGAMLWRSFQPRLVILDLMLPDGDGFELLRELWPESPVPVVVVTAKLLQTAELIILANVGAVVLHKGRFRRNELLEAVHKLMKETTLMQAKMRQ